MIWFIVGVVLGFFLACFAMTHKIIGELKYAIDEDGVHFFMKLPNPDVGGILGQKFVILKVDSKPTQE